MRLFVALSLLLTGAAAAVEPSVSAPCTPGVSFWSLLGAVDIGSTDARVHIDKLYAVCLPAPKTPSASNYAYSPDDGGKLLSVVKDANGQTLATYVWYAENISGLWELSSYKVLGGMDGAKTLAPGNYSLEFSADGAPFYRFPFAVAAADNDDPYQSEGKRYFIDGPWSAYGNLFYQRNDPQSSLRFTTWVQDRTTHPPHQTRPYQAQLVRVRDGAVLGADSGELHADRQWKQLDISFHPPGDANASLKAKDLLAEDGAYRVHFAMDGKPYGDYAFTVKGSAIQLQGSQLESADAQTRIVDYLYGGRYRSWWIARSAGAQIAR
jgi:hypothetical protein